MFKYQSLPHLIELSGKYEVGARFLPTGVCTGGQQCEPAIEFNDIDANDPHVHFEEFRARPLSDGDWIILPSGDSDPRYFDTISSEQLMADYRPVNEGRIEPDQEEQMWRLLAPDLNWDAVTAATPGFIEVLQHGRMDGYDVEGMDVRQLARNYAIYDQCKILIQQHGFAHQYARNLFNYVFQHHSENVKGAPVSGQSTPAGATPRWRQRLQKENPQ